MLEVLPRKITNEASDIPPELEMELRWLRHLELSLPYREVKRVWKMLVQGKQVCLPAPLVLDWQSPYVGQTSEL